MATVMVTTREQEVAALTAKLNRLEGQHKAHTASLRDAQAKLAQLESQRRLERRPKADGTPVDTSAITAEISKTSEAILGLEDLLAELRVEMQPIAERRQQVELKIADAAEVANIADLVKKQTEAFEAVDAARRRLQELEGVDGRLRQQIAESRRSRENRLKGIR